MNRNSISVLRLRVPILTQLRIEEALLRANNHNWCILNQIPSSSAAATASTSSFFSLSRVASGSNSDSSSSTPLLPFSDFLYEEKPHSLVSSLSPSPSPPSS